MNKQKVLDGIQRFTKSITAILMIILSLIVLFISSRILGLIGLVGGIYSLYPERLWLFWILLAVTRAGYSFGAFVLLEKIAEKLAELGYFWFKKPRSSYYGVESVDKSGDYIAGVFAFFLAVFIGELIIALSNFVQPPYL